MAYNRSIVLGLLASGLLLARSGLVAVAEEKVRLEDPPAQPADAGTPDLATQLKGLPDGVLLVKTNPDGSFKSLVVKATVEIEDVLGDAKGKRLAERDAKTQCKKALSQWLKEECVFTEASNATRSIITNGEKATDAAGNAVKLVKQKGVEVKVFTDTDGSFSKACLSGLITLQTQVSGDQKNFSLVMGLSQKTLSQAAAVKNVLDHGGNPAGQTTPKPSDPGTDGGTVKTNPEAKEFQ